MPVAMTIRVEGSPQQIYRATLGEGKRAITMGVRESTADLKNAWRGQVTGSGLGQRLANTIRGENYPKGRNSLNAAGLVYARPNRQNSASAADLIDAFDRGVTITSKDGLYLAIPLPAAAPLKVGRQRITPGLWEQRTGRRLRYVYRPGRPSLLVDDGTLHKSSYMTKSGFHKRRATPRKNVTKLIFVLLPQVRMPRKLNLQGPANSAIASLTAKILANFPGD